ncbi:hypothetical protein [Streptomyces fulvoviolaceus]|uniref:hypothetical protein n=1 Tax=Streptomyces fulvoviolaceus TaxID=285535 RepID=UPI0021BFBFCF|nr:hypothetical protein [Streptomyces fulvoviolaceus]MCT9078775.1 hypothetical protein [Streptomyces fulvoviolaceus]
MTTELSEAQRELADARREREELDTLINGLEEQVRDGEAVQAERELTAQYGLARLATLRQEAAERRVKGAEAEALRERQEAAVQAAREELGAASLDVVAHRYGAALAALDDLASVCAARDAAITRYREEFEALGLSGHVLAGPPQVVVQVDGEQYRAGDCQVDVMVLRVVDRLARARKLRQVTRSVGASTSYHPVELILTGLPREAARDIEASTSLAGPLLEAARAAHGGAEL